MALHSKTIASMLRAVRSVPFHTNGTHTFKASTSSPYCHESSTATRRYSTNHILSGRSVFAKASAAIQESSVQSQEAASTVPAMVELPTSDESDKLLRIRHSVS
jgi:S-adenosylmethionine hydrolase